MSTNRQAPETAADAHEQALSGPSDGVLDGLRAVLILALAAALYADGDTSTDVVTMAIQALIKQPDYALGAFQKDQLWGPKLREVTAKMFEDDRLKDTVERAKGLATFEPS